MYIPYVYTIFNEPHLLVALTIVHPRSLGSKSDFVTHFGCHWQPNAVLTESAITCSAQRT